MISWGGGRLFRKFNCLNCSGEIRDTLALLDIYHKTKSKGLESNPSQTESSKDIKSNREGSSVPKRRKHWLKKPDGTKSLIEETRRNEIIDWRNQTERNHWLKKPDGTKSLIEEYQILMLKCCFLYGCNSINFCWLLLLYRQII